MTKVSFLSPYSIECNIGKAYNEACEAVNTEWICITDQDAMFLLPDSKAKIIDVCSNTPEGHHVYSCMTNRLNPRLCKHQLYKGVCSEDANILNHKQIAIDLAVNPGLTPCGLVAGVCLIFRKSTWQINPFEENTPYFDQLFSRQILRRQGKLFVINHVYMFHMYRLGSADPVHDTTHLK